MNNDISVHALCGSMYIHTYIRTYLGHWLIPAQTQWCWWKGAGMDTPPLIDAGLEWDRYGQDKKPVTVSWDRYVGSIHITHALPFRLCSSLYVMLSKITYSHGSTQQLTVDSYTLSLFARSQHNNHCPLLDHCRCVTCRLLPTTLQIQEVTL